MRLKFIFSIGLGLLAAGFCFAQTANDFEKKYFTERYYEIRPNIIMTAEFDQNGQVCRVDFQPNRISKTKNTVYLGTYYLDPAVLNEIFDELVPATNREGEGKSMGYVINGSIGVAGYQWNNIRINTVFSFSRKRFGDSTNSMEAPNKENDKINALFSPAGIFPETASITWTKRMCLKQ